MELGPLVVAHTPPPLENRLPSRLPIEQALKSGHDVRRKAAPSPPKQGMQLLAPQLPQAQLLLRIQLWPSCQPFSMACDLKRGVGVTAYDRLTGCRPHDTK